MHYYSHDKTPKSEETLHKQKSLPKEDASPGEKEAKSEESGANKAEENKEKTTEEKPKPSLAGMFMSFLLDKDDQ